MKAIINKYLARKQLNSHRNVYIELCSYQFYDIGNDIDTYAFQTFGAITQLVVFIPRETHTIHRALAWQILLQ